MTAATSIAVHLPPAWVELDPRADLVAELGRRIEVPDSERTVALELLTPLASELVRQAAMTDVVLVGFFAQAVEIDGSAEPFVIAANVVLAISPQIGGLDEIRAVLAAGGSEIAPIELQAGAGVVATGETGISDPAWEGSVPARTRRYLVPVPGTDRMAALNFLTPNLDLADQFDEVFDAIAATLEFGYDDPDVAPTPAADA